MFRSHRMTARRTSSSTLQAKFTKPKNAQEPMKKVSAIIQRGGDGVAEFRELGMFVERVEKLVNLDLSDQRKGFQALMLTNNTAHPRRLEARLARCSDFPHARLSARL